MREFMKTGVAYVILCIYAFLFGACSDSDNETSKIYLDVNTENIHLKEEGGTAYINVASNTKWTILIENEDVPVSELEVTPLSGHGDETIKITYGREINKEKHEYANIIFYYYFEGERVSKEVSLTREENNDNKDDEESWITLATFAKVTNYLPVTFRTANGYNLIPSVNFINITSGDMYYIIGRYQESMINHDTKEINIELLADPLKIEELPIGFENVDVYPSNAPFYPSNSSEITPAFFDEFTLIVPIYFWVCNDIDDIQEELNRHSFMLVYDSNGNSDNNLELRLLHNISEDEDRIRTLFTAQFCVTNMMPAIRKFESEIGKKPNKITIKFMVNSSSDRLDNARTEEYVINYNSK